MVDPLNADVFIHTWDEKSFWLGFGGSPVFYRLFGNQPSNIQIKEINDLHKLVNYLPETYKVLKEPVNDDFDAKIFYEYFTLKELYWRISMIFKINYLIIVRTLL